MWLTSFWVADLFTIKQKLWTNKTPDVSCDTHKRCARLSPTRLLYFVYSEHKKSYIVHYAYYMFIYVTYSRVILFVNQTFTLQKQNWPHYQRSEQSPASPSCNYNSCSWHQQLWVMSYDAPYEHTESFTKSLQTFIPVNFGSNLQLHERCTVNSFLRLK